MCSTMRSARSHAARRPAGTEGPMRPGMAAWRGGRPAAGGGPTESTSEVSQSVRGPELWAGRRAAEAAAQASLAIPPVPHHGKRACVPGVRLDLGLWPGAACADWLSGSVGGAGALASVRRALLFSFYRWGD